jgi:coenzyme PQQ biosynthesis protein C
MNSGKLTREQIQGWVFNRFYYQTAIPVKDAAILSNMPDRDHRRQWITRILDHDGTQGDEGGIEAWLTLGEGLWACKRETSTSQVMCCPGVRFAVRSVHQLRTARAVAGGRLLAASPSCSHRRSTRSGWRTGHSIIRGSIRAGYAYLPQAACRRHP